MTDVPSQTDTYFFEEDEMGKKKTKKTVRLELEETSSVTPEKTDIAFSFGSISGDVYFTQHTVSVSLAGGRVESIILHGPGGHSLFSVRGNKNVDDLIDVMRRIVDKADALEVLND